MPSQQVKARTFRALHEREGAFVIPNPWDIGSARVLQALGFESLATTSSGFAQSLGKVDGQITLDEKIEHCRTLADATDVPISADLEGCFADRPEHVGIAIERAAEAGVTGCSIEDFGGGPDGSIYDFELAVERVRAAVETVKAFDFDFILTARAELLIRGGRDLDDTLRRLQAFEAAGADVLYAPGLSSLEQVAAFTAELSRPFNVLAPFVKGASVSDFAKAGAKRISVGGALARVAFGSLMSAAREMNEDGVFDWMDGISQSRGLDRLLAG